MLKIFENYSNKDFIRFVKSYSSQINFFLKISLYRYVNNSYEKSSTRIYMYIYLYKIPREILKISLHCLH